MKLTTFRCQALEYVDVVEDNRVPTCAASPIRRLTSAASADLFPPRRALLDILPNGLHGNWINASVPL